MCNWCRCAEDYEKAMDVIAAARAWVEADRDGANDACMWLRSKGIRAAVRALDGDQ